MHNFVNILNESWKSTVKVCLLLFKLIIPISIMMKIISELGLITYIGNALSPVMSVVGLPGSYALVWATGMLTNIYAALMVFSSVIAEEPLTAAQVSVLGIMILVAHALPIEASVARKSGIRLRISLLIRCGFALLYGIILNLLFSFFRLYQEAPMIIWYPKNTGQGIGGWILGELSNYAKISIIIFTLITLMNILKASGIMNIIIRILTPLLKGLGIGENAIPITIIGTVLGYAYGGGLIIEEANSGRVSRKDLFYTIVFLSLCHSIFEDSLLMISIGAKGAVVFTGRFILSYITCSAIVFLTKNMDREKFLRIFFRPDKRI